MPNMMSFQVEKIVQARGNKNLNCPQCPYETPNRKLMKNHIEAVHENKKNDKEFKEFRCEFCRKISTSQSGLTRHMKAIHPNEKIQLDNMLQCDECPKFCKNVSGLTRHKKLHI